MEYKDYYAILGVDKNSSQADIKKAYRKLAKKYHPDANKGDKKSEEKFKEINEAFEVLGNEEKKKKYDMFGQSGNFYQGMDFDPSEFGFGGFGGRGHTYTYTTGNGDFSDFFNMFFGGGAGSGSAFGFDDIFGNSTRTRHNTRSYSQQPGQDIESETQVDIKEAYNGSKKQFTIDTGMGKQSISVTIPAGITPGKKIKLKGQGLPGPTGVKGDLYIKIQIKPDPKFILNGLDITSVLEILPWDAYFGTDKIVETLDGKIKLKVPPQIQSGNKIKVPNKGYKDMQGKRGNLYVEIKIVNPSSLPPEGEEAYKKLRQLTTEN